MEFKIKNRIITTTDKTLVIGDNADYIAHFSFDEEWEGVTKTARFINCNNEHKDVLLEDDQCTIPCEVLKCGYAKVGVYSSEMTTTEYEFTVTKSIKSDSGCECEPTPDVYAQLTKLLDDLYKLMPSEIERYFTENSVKFKGDKGDKGDPGAVKFVPVNELPTENIEEDAIYLKPSENADEQNKYDEYVYTNGAWECIGTANVVFDAEGYVKTTNEVSKIYGTDEKGNQKHYAAQVWEIGDTIPLRNTSGQLWSKLIPTKERQTYNTTQGWLVHENYLTHYVDGRFLTGETDPTTETVGYQIGALYTNTATNSSFVLDSITTDETTGAKTYNWGKLIRPTDYAVKNVSPGIVDVQSNCGLDVRNGKILVLQSASEAGIDDRGDLYCAGWGAITPKNLDYAMSTNYLKGTTAPTTETKAPFVGALYLDTTNNATYQCTAIDETNKTYTWTKLIRATDYADGSTDGIVHGNGTYGGYVMDGHIIGISKTAEQYEDLNQYYLICKGTLDNIRDTYVIQALTNNSITLTDEEKAKIKTWLGL